MLLSFPTPKILMTATAKVSKFVGTLSTRKSVLLTSFMCRNSALLKETEYANRGGLEEGGGDCNSGLHVKQDLMHSHFINSPSSQK